MRIMRKCTVVENEGMKCDGEGNSELMKCLLHISLCNRVEVVNKH